MINNSKRELEEKILFLVNKGLYLTTRAEKFKIIFENNKTFLDKYLYPKDERMIFLVDHYNLYVDNITIIITTLLSKDRQEVCFKKLFEIVDNEPLKKDYRKITDDNKNVFIKKIRDNYAAHKKDGFTNVASILGANFYNEEILKNSKEILEKINIICIKYFDDPICNNELINYHKKSDQLLDEFLTLNKFNTN